MKKGLALMFLATLIISCVGCGVTTINPGYVGIVVNKTGTNRGVNQHYELTTGRVYYNPFTEDIVEYPTFVQNAIWTQNPNEGRKGVDESITFTTKDSMIVNADFNAAYTLQQEMVPAFYVKFRSDDLSNFTDGYLHNQARECINDVAGAYDVEEIMGDNAKFLHDSLVCLQQAVGPIGVHIEQFGLVGAPRPPETVLSAINAKVQATQIALQKQNEIVQAEADAKKRVAQATGEAEANQKLANSLTPTLLEWQRLENQKQAISKWSGVPPAYIGGGSGTTLFQVPFQTTHQ